MEIDDIKNLAIKNIRKMDNGQLWSLVKDIRDKKFRVGIELKTGQSSKNQDKKRLKRQLARVLTVIREQGK